MKTIYPCTLSKAEKEVLKLSNEDKTSQEIADKRGTDRHTIENQLWSARKKVKKCQETLKNAKL